MANQFAPLTTLTDSLGTATFQWNDIFVKKLGQSIDVNGFGLVSVSDGDIALTPNGTGRVNLTNPTLISDLIVNGQSITSLSNGNITLSPNGNGSTIATGAGTGTALVTNQTGAGSIVDFQLNGTSAFIMANNGNVTMTGQLTIDDIVVFSLPDTTGEARGTTYQYTTDTILAIGDIVAHGASSDEVQLADADTDALKAIGVALNATNGTANQPVKVMTVGVMELTAWSGLAAQGVLIYLSSTLGELTVTEPTGSGVNRQVIGTYDDATNGSISFNFNSSAFIDAALWANMGAGGLSLPFSGVGSETSGTEFQITANSLTTGTLAKFSTSAAGFTGSAVLGLIDISVSNAGASGRGIRILNAGTGDSIAFDTNGNASSIDIDSESTSSNVINLVSATVNGSDISIVSNALTTGKVFNASTSSTAFTGALIQGVVSGNNGAVVGDIFFASTSGASSVARCARFVGATTGVNTTITQNTVAGTALVVDQNTNALSFNIDSSATTADTVNIGSIGSGDALQIVQGGTGNLLKLLDGGTDALIVAGDGQLTSTSSSSSAGVGFTINMTGSDSILAVQDSGTDRLLMVNDASGSTKVLFTTAGSSTGFAHNHTGTGTAFELQDGGTSVFSVADGGDITSTGELNIDNMIIHDIPNAADEARGMGFNYTTDTLMAVGRIVGHGTSSDEVQLADANTAALRAIGVTISTTDGSANQPVKVMTVGILQAAAFVGLGAQGSLVYLDTTAGNLTLTAPAGSGDLVQIIGTYDDATNGSISFNFSSNGTTVV